jgi:hypothetical protein
MKRKSMEMPPTTSGSGADHGKSVPMAGVSQRSKPGHGDGYPLSVPSIDHSMPSHGTTETGKSNQHGYSYPGKSSKKKK